MTYTDEPGSGGFRAAYNRRRPLFVLLIVLCLLFLASYTSKLGQLRGAERELAAQNERLADAQIQRKVLEARLEDVSRDAYIVEQAIVELNMVREDETVIVLVEEQLADEQTKNEESPPGEEMVGVVESNGRVPAKWQLWIDLLR